MSDMSFSYNFCCLTFIAKQKSHEHCGSNGLPLTPSCIKILGRAQLLKTLYHPNITTYVDVLRGKYERTIIITEKTGIFMRHYEFKNPVEIVIMAKDVLSGLSYVHEYRIIHRSLSKDTIYRMYNSWILFNYGLFYMTENGEDVSFPIGCLKYTSPLSIFVENHISNPQDDLWSLGVIIVELLLACDLWKDCSNETVLQRMCELSKHDGSMFHKLSQEIGKGEEFKRYPKVLIDFVDQLLDLDSSRPKNAKDMLKHEIFDLVREEEAKYRFECWSEPRLSCNNIKEIYHYWEMAGGDILQELKKNGSLKNRLSVLNMPNLLLLEGRTLGARAESDYLPSFKIVKLDAMHTLTRLAELVEGRVLPESEDLPLVIREKDIDYQFHRMQKFNNIIKGMPAKRKQLMMEAKTDVPPFLRAIIWAHLLQVPVDYKIIYRSIDKETPFPSDRQIEVDIPRCHQYNELLSSCEAHKKFKRILKAWVASHPNYVYWQGLDSLAAPFLYLNFVDEALAYASLTNFISNYLDNFFLKDNTQVIKEYLFKFRQLITFHEPTLSYHFQNIQFSPDLYAIPWFLTMFSHVLPIHKIFHLWDSLLLGDASFPLFIGLSILKQLIDMLYYSGFNECILLFSDLPELDIEDLVNEAVYLRDNTPSSILFRQQQQRIMNKSYLIPVPFAEIEHENSPRISAVEVYELILNSMSHLTILVVDIRDKTSYSLQHVIWSVNVPITSNDLFAKHPTDSRPLNHRSEIKSILQYNNKIKIIVADEMNLAVEFCNRLVQYSLAKVCCVHGGFTALKNYPDILRS